MALSRWLWHSHHYENHNNTAASIKEIIGSTQLLRKCSGAFSQCWTWKAVYMDTNQDINRLQMKSVQNIATVKYTSSSGTQMCSSWTSSFPWQVGQRKINFHYNNSIHHLLFPMFSSFFCSHKKMKVPLEDDALIMSEKASQEMKEQFNL